jgi:hypothetical protein
MWRLALVFAVACASKHEKAKPADDIVEAVRASETACETATECSVVDTSCGCCKFAAISGNGLVPWTERHQRECREATPCNCQAPAMTADCVDGACVLR